MAYPDVVGCWFPTGFYGHFRNKPRNDFQCEYRRLAQPPPPRRFIFKSNLPPRKHPFSHHDNRNAFITDALMFGEGRGRRRPQTSLNKSRPDVIRWTGSSEPTQKQKHTETSYRNAFHLSYPVAPLVLPRRPMTSYSGDALTTYRHAYCHDIPREKISDTFRYTPENRRQTTTSIPAGRNDVAACMVWYTPSVTHSTNIAPNVAPNVAAQATITTNCSQTEHPKTQTNTNCETTNNN